jgi:hypothetical protein
MMRESQIIEEFVNTFPVVEDAHRYIIFTPAEDPEYMVLLFRTVREVHCYYKGYGLSARKRALSAFDTPQEVLEWALAQRDNMELVANEELSPIDRIFLGLSED